MAFKLGLISKDPSGVLLLAAYGEATARDFPTTETMLFDTLLGENWAGNRIALDMDAVPYLDSSAIGWMIQAQKHFRAAGGSLTLHSVQPHVRNILNLLKIERVVPITRDGAAARKLLQERERAADTASA